MARPLIRPLRQASPDPTAADRVLCAAIAKGAADEVQRLLTTGADPASVNHWGEPALMLAAKSGNVAIVQALLAAGADIDDHFQEERAISYAVAANHVDVVRTLLDAGASTSDAGKFSLVSIAADHGAWDVLRLLLSIGADINSRGRRGHSPLQAAAGQGLLDIVRELLAAGADVKHRSNRDALRDAVANGHEAVALELISAGAIPRVPAKHAVLALAAGAGLARVVEALLAHRADPNFADAGLTDDATALIAAAADGHAAVVKLLLENGADVRARDSKGRTALDRVRETKPSNLAEIEGMLEAAAKTRAKPRRARASRASGAARGSRARKASRS